VTSSCMAAAGIQSCNKKWQLLPSIEVHLALSGTYADAKRKVEEQIMDVLLLKSFHLSPLYILFFCPRDSAGKRWGVQKIIYRNYSRRILFPLERYDLHMSFYCNMQADFFSLREADLHVKFLSSFRPLKIFLRVETKMYVLY